MKLSRLRRARVYSANLMVRKKLFSQLPEWPKADLWLNILNDSRMTKKVFFIFQDFWCQGLVGMQSLRSVQNERKKSWRSKEKLSKFAPKWNKNLDFLDMAMKKIYSNIYNPRISNEMHISSLFTATQKALQ